MSSQRSSDISCRARGRLLQLCQELKLQVNCRKSSLIPSQDMAYLDMQIQSVRFIANPTATWVENLLRIIEEFLSSPDPPAALFRRLLGHLSSLTLLVKGGMLWIRCFQIRLRSWWDFPRRVPSHPLGSSVSGGSSMVVLGDSTTRGRRSFFPSARLELLLGRVRRRLGCHRRGAPSVRSLVYKPKGTLHQPQGDDGSPGWPLKVQLSSQRQDDRSLLRLCHDSRLPQVIGRHEVSGSVPRSVGDSPVGRIHEDHATSPVNPGVSQHESGSSQSAQPGDGFGMDPTPGGSPGPSSPVAGDHRPVHYIAVSKAPCVLCSSVGTPGSGGGCIPPALGQPPGICLPTHCHHNESSSQTKSLSHLRSHPDRPLLVQRKWFPALLDLLSDIPVELP